jgi:S-adenosylmethionine:tRNA ribosyltransferase-isomerase
MSSQLSDYDYKLPRELIASRPLPKRDESRLMILRRDGQIIEHRKFRELPAIVGQDDLFVLNDTRVLAARLFSDDGSIEFLLLERIAANQWRCLAKPGKKTRIGSVTTLGGVRARVDAINDEGERIITLDREVDLYSLGVMPLPPYLERPSDAEDSVRYQTVFAQKPGAVAAPTAGLHFSEEMLRTLPHTFVTLHVGPGTFRPVRHEDIGEHRMHSEQFSITDEAAKKINGAQRIVAVGTTTVRVLESVCDADGIIRGKSGSTDIFIYPPFEFRVTDALLTNFHLPRSTLLMLVSAFAGREFILRAYAEAIRERYRFFSYGDCMLIL